MILADIMNYNSEDNENVTRKCYDGYDFGFVVVTGYLKFRRNIAARNCECKFEGRGEQVWNGFASLAERVFLSSFATSTLYHSTFHNLWAFKPKKNTHRN